mmetsp:Transcript_84857/g.263545  ORF Transcript_84857/g.263545 Transcript_84857/m.263545 type:complete len:457 (-) Transcript_84857:113-1483(-)
MSAAAAHRAAVVGGGVSGGVCAALLQRQGLSVTLFERSRRLGGRASARRVALQELQRSPATSEVGHLHFDHGAQFFTVTDARFEMLIKSPVLSGLVEAWHGRFGVLGSSGGEVLPRQNVLTSGMFRVPSARADATGDPAAAQAAASAAAARRREIGQSAINFCGFLEGSSSQSLFVGADGVGSLVPAMLARAGVNVQRGVRVTDLAFKECSGSGRRRWFLETDQDAGPEPFDSVVLANHDPAFAAATIERLQAEAPDPELSQDAVEEVIGQFKQRLRGLRSARQSRYSLVLAFPRPLRELAFDAVSVHGSELQFLSRDSSKPGRPRQGEGDGVECWVVQTSPEFAALLDKELGQDSSAEAAARIWAASEGLLGRFFQGESLPVPLYSRAHRWSSAFFSEPLDLGADGGPHNDAVSFAPWALALCGDYLGARQGIQEAALSGMMAANRVAQWSSSQV